MFINGLYPICYFPKFCFRPSDAQIPALCSALSALGVRRRARAFPSLLLNINRRSLLPTAPPLPASRQRPFSLSRPLLVPARKRKYREEESADHLACG